MMWHRLTLLKGVQDNDIIWEEAGSSSLQYFWVIKRGLSYASGIVKDISNSGIVRYPEQSSPRERNR